MRVKRVGENEFLSLFIVVYISIYYFCMMKQEILFVSFTQL